MLPGITYCSILGISSGSDLECNDGVQIELEDWLGESEVKQKKTNLQIS